MSLLLCFAVGAGAKVITTTPVAGTQYKIKCLATDHTGYLGDDGTTLQGRHATGTWFVLVSNGTEGQYYLRSASSGKYINAAGNTSGSAISFDAEASTYWTIDQTNANTGKYSWAIRPNGTAGVSLNNNGSATSGCPYMKVNVHNSNTQGCDLWTFDDGEIVPFTQPAFGGTVWTWNTSTSKFDANGKESTATPGRESNMGPVYKFENVGTVTTAVNPDTDTSDRGGIWVIGNTSNVTSSIGRWAGSILVEDYAIASVNYSQSLKGLEADGAATVWTNGTLTITGRTNFNMNDGNAQRWYIGENGVINTNFTSVTKGSREWNLNVVVGDQPERTDTPRSTVTLKKKVMTWGADISSNINSITVWYKDAEGNLTLLNNGTAVQYDATGITIVYEGLGYDEKEPSLPENKYVSVSTTKANFLVAAENAADNTHWYIITQTRNGESPVYDNGANTLMRASTTTDINGLTPEDSKQYLVRFFATETEGVYDIQFATGKFIKGNLTTGKFFEGASYKLYNINGEATHIGWNLYNNGFGSIVDNDGAGNTLSFWGSGEVTQLNNNNDWSIYPVEFVDGVSIAYTLNAVNGESYSGTYVTGWAEQNTQLPTLGGAAGYTLSHANFVKNGDTYTATMDITFPFPVSSETVKKATGIRSALGSATWRAKLNGETYEAYTTNNEENITINNANEFLWYIYPSFNEGVFSFKLHNKAADKYMPAFTAAQNANTVNALADAANAGSFYLMPCTGNGKGFSINPEGTIFLTINSGTNDNQPIWTWTKNGSHEGSNLTFPTIAKSEEAIRPAFAALKAATPFDILDGSIVQGPSEFANPRDINTAIEEARNIDENDLKAMYDFNTGTNGQMIQNYLNQVAAYGALFNHQFTVNHQYGTIILPCPSTKPEGITFYSCSATEENGTTLTLIDDGDMEANKPYIYESTVGNKYTIIGWDKGSRADHANGWLTGSLAEAGANVPDGSYVLAANKTTGKQGFYKTNGTVTCPQFKCYLTVPAGAAAPKALFFPGGEGEQTGIENVFGADENGTVTIYNLAGQRLNKLEKGINIVNGRKVLVK